MNSSLNAQRNNRIFFFAAVGFSAVLLAAAGFLLTNLLNGGSAKGLKQAEKVCTTNLRANGFIPDTSKKGVIKVNRAEVESVEQTVYQSGVLIANCPAYTLTDYCAGAGCPNPGVSFTLTSKEL